jgi:hypothetical protein
MTYPNKAFDHETINIDGNVYEHCTFNECVFVYHGGKSPTFLDCAIVNPTFGFEGAAKETLMFLKSLTQAGFGDTVARVIADVLGMPHPK